VKFVYMATRGAGDPTLASMPFHLAVNGSVEVGHDTAIVLAGDAAELLLGDNPETVEGLGLPPLRDLIAKVRKHQVPVYV
jgi:predicted peroxiredoxin